MSAYGPLAKWYDLLTRDVPYTEFADYYEGIFKARTAAVDTILDLACGTGTLTYILAERGYELIGVDASPDMLSLAAEKAGELEKGIKPLFLCQELAELDLYGTVDAAVSCLDGMNYLPPNQLPRVFHRLKLFIRPGGLFIFDVHSPERLRSLDGGTFVDESRDVLCLWRAEYDRKENYLVYGMDIFTRSGNLWSREREEHIEYAHEPDMLAELLKNAGFGNIEMGAPGPHRELGRIFIVAERK
ncbi:MAG TPA: class I SAM-dependent methyltransferase [Clostridiales bacterium]|jgi:SAM-dependent methyltransferase|nr:class I SAM-dependent methyltransferase [Clostridiales bacterium]